MIPNVVVYTCITGDYDKFLFSPPLQSKHISFVCFTDNNKIKAKGWDVVPLKFNDYLERPDLVNRYHKFHPHLILPSYEYSVYIDGNIRIVSDLVTLIEDFIASRAAFGCFSHPERDDIFSEAEACRHLSKFKNGDEASVLKQLSYYSKHVGSESLGLYAGCVLLRHHKNPVLKKAMPLWWQHVIDFTARDQLSLPYVIWKTNNINNMNR